MWRTLNAFSTQHGRGSKWRRARPRRGSSETKTKTKTKISKTTFNSTIILSCTDRLPCLRSIGELSPRHRRRGRRADRAVSLARDAVSLAVQGPLRTTRSALRCGKFLRLRASLRTFLAPEKSFFFFPIFYEVRNKRSHAISGKQAKIPRSEGCVEKHHPGRGQLSIVRDETLCRLVGARSSWSAGRPSAGEGARVRTGQGGRGWLAREREREKSR